MSPLLASTALGLVAAWPVGALGFGLGRLVERLTDDPRPRAAAWSLAYALPAGALAATVALTFAPVAMPSPKVAASIVPGPARMFVVEMTDNGAAPPSAATAPWTPPPLLGASLAWSLVGLSAAGLVTRGWRWNRGRRRLAKIRATSEPCQDYALVEAVRVRAAHLGVKAPRVRISADIAEPMLAGARRPVILLPKTLADNASAHRLALVCGHELAHLRRGDNWRIPAEEALAGLFWLTPPISALRGRMLAAREAVCDLTALDGAAPEARQDYARALVEALKMNARPSPQSAFESAFTGRDRNLVSLRLKAILQPRGGASAGRVGLVFALGGALTVVTGAGSLALADQARRIAPLASAQTSDLAKAIVALAHTDATPPADPVAAVMVRQNAAQTAAIAEVDQTVVEAAQATEAAPAAEAAPASPVPPASPAAPARVAPVAPVAMAAPRPDPRPDPHPDPHPDPRPNPQPNQHSVERSISADINKQKARIDIRADEQVVNVAQGTTVYLGDVTVRGHLNPVLVTLKVNGRAAPAGFTPTNLAEGAIQRLEFTDRTVSVDGKMTVNVVLKDIAP